MDYVKKFTAWSFSRYADYAQCPLKAKLKHIDKLMEPPNVAMARGAELHGEVAAYLTHMKPRLTAKVRAHRELLSSCRKFHGTCHKEGRYSAVEEMWAFDKNWAECRWNDWARCTVRIKLDCAQGVGSDLIIYDWKTGRFRPEQEESYLEQLELYALAGLLKRPDMTQVRPRLVYLDTGDTHPTTPLMYTPKDIPMLRARWAKRTQKMLADRTFTPTPNNHCRWCYYRQDNSGPCKF